MVHNLFITIRSEDIVRTIISLSTIPINIILGVQDPNDPFNNDARPNSWTPPLNTSWTWGTDQVFGVNLGGWLVIEPFITPQFFEQYPTAVDEFTLSEAMRADTENGGIAQLEEHYNTFIVSVNRSIEGSTQFISQTEEDIAEIAGRETSSFVPESDR